MYTQQGILDVVNKNELDKHAIIAPPDEFKYFGNETKYTRVVIDSMLRNVTSYPDQSDYYYVLDDDIDDVLTARLVMARIPFNEYQINKYFNKLWVTFNNGTETGVDMVQGKYDETSLASMIQTQLNTAFGSGAFTITYNAIKQKIMFASTQAFSINFTYANALSKLLGFKESIYTSTGNAIEPPYVCNLDFNNIILLCIDQFDNNKSNAKPFNKSYAVFYNKKTTITFEDEPTIMKTFNPPIARLPKMHLSFFDRFGNPYDFQNRDHQIEILFTSNKQRRKYHSIFGLKQ